MVAKYIFSLAAVCNGIGLFAQSTNPTVDATFGNAGVVTTTFNTSGHAYGQRLVMQNDGTFFIIGSAGSTSTSHMAAVLYTSSGKPDSSFGVNGKVIIPFGSGSVSDHAICYTLESDGILLGGYFRDNSGKVGMAVQKMNFAGALDSQWGSKGRFSLDFGSISWVCGIHQNADKGHFIFGSSAMTSNKFGIVVIKLDSSGRRDSSFAQNGQFTWSTPWAVEAVTSARDADGNTYLAGEHLQSALPFLCKFGNNGLPDSSYGTHGIAKFKDVYPGKIWDIAVQDDGKPVCVGYIEIDAKPVTVVCRFLADGDPDPVFAYQGQLATNQSDVADYGRAIAISPKKNIYVVSMPLGANQFAYTSILKLDSSGKRDVLFGSFGVFNKQFASREDNPADIVVDDQGRILLAGRAVIYSTLSGFFVSRLLDQNVSKINTIRSNSEFQVYPNPARDIIYLSSTGNHSPGPVQLRFSDISGKEIWVKDLAVTQGQTTPILLPKGIPPGTYYLQILGSGILDRRSVTIVSE